MKKQILFFDYKKKGFIKVRGEQSKEMRKRYPPEITENNKLKITNK